MAKRTHNLQQAVKGKIKSFLNTSNRIFFNERDLQMHLALWLKQHSKWNVEVEYFVPSSAFLNQNNYPWKKANGKDLQDMYVDIVVCDETEYVPIELKYKTRKANGFNSLRFGKNAITTNLKNQSAQDLGRYDFWKDIYRLELVRSTFPTVMHGIALFVTNDPAYINNTNDPRVNYYDFHMKDGRTNVTGRLDWKNNNSKVAKDHPGFTLAGMYDIHWTPIGAHSNPRSRADFSYCLVIV